MDETKHPWFRWIADHAQYFFWGIWGAGVGVFVGVWLQTLPAPDGTLRFYLTVLTTAMAGIAGLVSARAMDSVADRRKRRRRILTLSVRLTTLRMAVNQFAKDLEIAEQQRPEAPSVTVSLEMLVRARDINANTENSPNFEDIIDDRADVYEARRLQQILVHLRHSFSWVDLDQTFKDDDHVRALGVRVRGPVNEVPTMRTIAEVLETIANHFASKIGV